MKETQDKNEDSDVYFNDSQGHIWLDITRIKGDGQITLEFVEGAEVILDSTDIYVADRSPELLIELSENDEERIDNALTLNEGALNTHEDEIYGKYEPYDPDHSLMINLCDLVDDFHRPDEDKAHYIHAVWNYYVNNRDTDTVHTRHSESYRNLIVKFDEFISALDGLVMGTDRTNQQRVVRGMGDWAHEWEENLGVSGALWH